MTGSWGEIHVGRFEQNHHEVVVEANGRRSRTESLAFQRFPQRQYGEAMPEFADRFGNAYKTEVAEFIAKCVAGQEFSLIRGSGDGGDRCGDAGGNRSGVRCRLSKNAHLKRGEHLRANRAPVLPRGCIGRIDPTASQARQILCLIWILRRTER